MREEKEAVRASAARVCRASCRDSDPDSHTQTLQDAEGAARAPRAAIDSKEDALSTPW